MKTTTVAIVCGVIGGVVGGIFGGALGGGLGGAVMFIAASLIMNAVLKSKQNE